MPSTIRSAIDGCREKIQLAWLVRLRSLLCLWELGSRAAPKLQLYVPPISQVMVTLGQLALAGPIVKHLMITLGRFLEGYLLSAAIGVSLGIVLGYFRIVHSFLEMSIEFLRPMPSVAIIPVAILALGIGDSMIVAVTVYATVWPILINTLDGVRRIERSCSTPAARSVSCVGKYCGKSFCRPPRLTSLPGYVSVCPSRLSWSRPPR